MMKGSGPTFALCPQIVVIVRQVLIPVQIAIANDPLHMKTRNMILKSLAFGMLWIFAK